MAYFDRHFSLPTGYRYLLRDVPAFLASLGRYAPPGGGWLLDFGCGNRPYRRIIGGYRYVGLDYFGHVSRPDCAADMLRAPVKDGVADACLTVWVLDDFPEPLQALAEVARVLKPGGYYFAVENQSTNRHFPPRDFFRFTPEALGHLAGRVGLELVSAESYAGDFGLAGFALIQALRKALHRVRGARHLIPLACLGVNALFAPLDRLARRPRFGGAFEDNSIGYGYVFRKRAGA